MPETQISPEKQQPTKETFRHLRHQLKDRLPSAKKLFDKSGTEPSARELINNAGAILRAEMESDYDSETGLLNKRGFNKKKIEAVREALKGNYGLAAAVIDLDNLKEVNDKSGHEAGDALIREAASAIVEVSRDDDIVARVGGDEFNLILTHTDPELAVGWKKRITDEFLTRGIKASVGVDQVNGEDLETSLKTADSLMYVEKRIHKHNKSGLRRLLSQVSSVVIGKS